MLLSKFCSFINIYIYILIGNVYPGRNGIIWKMVKTFIKDVDVTECNIFSIKQLKLKNVVELKFEQVWKWRGKCNCLKIKEIILR